MARLKQNICFERIQIYLHPEIASKLRSEALIKRLNVSKYIRNILNEFLIYIYKGNGIK